MMDWFQKITYQEAELLMERRLDRRRQYYKHTEKGLSVINPYAFNGSDGTPKGIVFTIAKWSHACSGCSDEYEIGGRGIGCHECGYTGRRCDWMFDPLPKESEAKRMTDIIHNSDCAIYNEPAYPAKPCNCGFEDRARQEIERLRAELDNAKHEISRAKNIAKRIASQGHVSDIGLDETLYKCSVCNSTGSFSSGHKANCFVRLANSIIDYTQTLPKGPDQ